MTRYGLVLSGGGAKGAYEAGVLKALDARGIEVNCVSGASIGALTAAVLSAAPSQREGTRRIYDLWVRLANEDPIKDGLRIPFLEFLIAAGLHLHPALKSIARQFAAQVGAKSFGGGLVDDQPIRELLQDSCNPADIGTLIPCFVSVYPAASTIEALQDFGPAFLGIGNSKDSIYLDVSAMRVEERLEAVLASASIPLLFPPRKVGGNTYLDGGLGDWQGRSGNTPAKPLVRHCDRMIVVHLEDGSLWTRTDLPRSVTPIEIRPRSAISRKGGLRDVLAFNNTAVIHEWIEQGIRDTHQTFDEWDRTQGILQDSRDQDQRTDDAMRRLMSEFEKPGDEDS